jgi:S-formylglutathione hydrolase FrmB
MSRCLAVLLLALCPCAASAALEIHLTYDAATHTGPFTGRVYVMLTKGNVSTLRSGPNWFNPEPCFARDVQAWKPGEKLVIDRSALGYPVTLDRVAKGTWSVQAVMDLAPGSRHFSTAPGNVHGIATNVALDPATTGTVSLKLDKTYSARAFKETDRVKLVEVESKLLTDFHRRPTHLRAGVALPASYAKDTKRSYPVVYEIPGFGGTHSGAFGRVRSTSVAGTEVLWVVLSPDCHHGHHVFADSANNGPVGRALVEELIPAIEKKFRVVAKPGARLLTGHSSGGWSSLWLQVAYPDTFGGVWSTAPDPVDFRDFQRINVYQKGENMFADAEGKPRPIARRGGKPVLWFRGFSDMEVVMGHGGQLRSFEAVFSPRGADGQPRPLWDRKTGAIDPEVAKSWEKYDIRLVLERNWKTLGPKLAGKLHVYMGDMDNFYLDGAARLLGESLKKLGSDAKVELFAGKDHGSLMDRQLRERIAREMAAQLKGAGVVE